MRIKQLAWIPWAIAVLTIAAPAGVAQANVAQPPERMAFEFAVGLINFATFPVVWFTFPALGPGPTTQAQALAVFTLLAALLYAGLLVRLQPAFHPARRSMVVGLLAIGLPLATVLIFGAATAASAAVEALAAGSATAAGAGLPYTVTMPASEVFAYSAEALLIFLLCRPVLSARQAVLLSVLANSASLTLGLILL